MLHHSIQQQNRDPGHHHLKNDSLDLTTYLLQQAVPPSPTQSIHSRSLSLQPSNTYVYELYHTYHSSGNTSSIISLYYISPTTITSHQHHLIVIHSNGYIGIPII